MTNHDEYREKRRQDPEYRRVERKMKILCFPEEVWFRLRMWIRDRLRNRKGKIRSVAWLIAYAGGTIAMAVAPRWWVVAGVVIVSTVMFNLVLDREAK